MAQVFISYSHKDSSYAHALARELKLHGIDAWIDDRIDYGSKWPAVIQESLDQSKAFIVIQSSHSKSSEWVERELLYAQEKSKPIFPILLEGEVWFTLMNRQAVDAKGGRLPPEDFYTYLKNLLSVDSGKRPPDNSPRKLKHLLFVLLLVAMAAMAVFLYLRKFTETASLQSTETLPAVQMTNSTAIGSIAAMEAGTVTSGAAFPTGTGTHTPTLTSTSTGTAVPSSTPTPEDADQVILLIDDYYRCLNTATPNDGDDSDYEACWNMLSNRPGELQSVLNWNNFLNQWKLYRSKYALFYCSKNVQNGVQRFVHIRYYLYLRTDDSVPINNGNPYYVEYSFAHDNSGWRIKGANSKIDDIGSFCEGQPRINRLESP